MRKVDPDNTPAPKVAQPDHAGHWGKLSKHHFAVIRLCDKEGNPKPNSPEVYGLVTDGDFSVESQWQSPFENSNPDMKAPALLGMLQSGEIAGFLGRASASAMPALLAPQSQPKSTNTPSCSSPAPMTIATCIGLSPSSFLAADFTWSCSRR